MTGYLLDTNHVSALWKGDSTLVDRVRLQPAADFAIPLPAVGELWFMVFNSRRRAQNRRALSALLRDFTLLPFEMSAAIEFGKIKSDLVRGGTVTPDIDTQIAAISRSNGLVLLTADAHFSYVSGLVTESWLI